MRSLLAAHLAFLFSQTGDEAVAHEQVTGIDIHLLRSLPGKRFPILIYTAQDESEMYGETWDELQRLGADDIVMKGMNVGESLARKVSGLLGMEWDEGE